MLFHVCRGVAFGGNVFGRANAEISFFCCGFDAPFEPGVIIGGGIAFEFVQQELAEAEAKIFGKIDRGQEVLFEEFFEVAKTAFHVAIAGSGVISGILFVVIKEVRLELVKGDMTASDGLPFDDQLGLFLFENLKCLFVVIALGLIFRLRIGEDT